MTQPPELPPSQASPTPHVPYATPGYKPPEHLSDAQRVMDLTVGVNARGRDNLIQLGAVVAGGLLGWVAVPPLLGWPAAAGAVTGVVAGLLLSGLVIGIVRTVKAARARRGGR